MQHHHWHPLVAAGSTLSGLGAVFNEYLPAFVGFGLTLFGLWLQRRENRRHESEMDRIMPEQPPSTNGKP